MEKFTYKNKDFLLDNKKISLRSGAIHYFRVPESCWRDRLLKLKECGFNCVETYLAWNMHEKNEGEFNFDANLNFGKFLDIAKELGLMAIVRPGPYICAEWEFGGLPYWLLNYPELQVRCNNSLFLQKLKLYLLKVATYINPRLVVNGGNVIMVQVENEYGGFGDDKQYLKSVYNIIKGSLDECVLFTSDFVADKDVFINSMTEGCIPMGNFGSQTKDRIENLKEYAPNYPLMCAEFWCGWFDRWHGEHHVRDGDDYCRDLEVFLQNDYSFNVYMFHGGTNFGFMNGAILLDGHYQPTVTSYDYCAPLNEAGDRTPTYYKIRELISKYVDDIPPLTAQETEKRAYGRVDFHLACDLLDNVNCLSKPISSLTPLFMEDINQGYGYTLYVCDDFSCFEEKELTLIDAKDRALVYCDGTKLGLYERGLDNQKIIIKPNTFGKLQILLENMGRNNYGPYMFEKKGLGKVLKGGRNVFGWKCYPLPMDNLDNLNFVERSPLGDKPAFYKAQFNIDKVCDTFVKPIGFTKGIVIINGFNLGRFYNPAGPQKTLFVPNSILKEGVNEIIVFESDCTHNPYVEFVAQPEL